MIKNRIYKALMAALAFGAICLVLPAYAARETSTANPRPTAGARQAITTQEKRSESTAPAISGRKAETRGKTAAAKSMTTATTTAAPRISAQTQTSTSTPSVTSTSSPTVSAGGISAPPQTSTSTPSVTQSPSPSPSAGGISAPPPTTYKYYVRVESLQYPSFKINADDVQGVWYANATYIAPGLGSNNWHTFTPANTLNDTPPVLQIKGLTPVYGINITVNTTDGTYSVAYTPHWDASPNWLTQTSRKINDKSANDATRESGPHLYYGPSKGNWYYSYLSDGTQAILVTALKDLTSKDIYFVVIQAPISAPWAYDIGGLTSGYNG